LPFASRGGVHARAVELFWWSAFCACSTFEKSADYYFPSHAFLTKLSVFIAVALLSIIPTVEFLSWRKDVRKGQEPAVTEQKLRFLRKVIHGESVAVVIILLSAAITVRGGWV
jgi:putative membrane protein